ncbi:MAG: glycerol kinase GlpK [Mangrovibacterium sp.]
MKQHPAYILSIDQSTSATKTMLFNREGKLVRRISLSHSQHYPKTGFVEHDAEEIWENTCTAIRLILEAQGISSSELAGLAITNQRETALIWDKRTGKPVCHAAVWQCQRGKAYCDRLREEGKNELIRNKTGLLIDPYFSASKLQWIMENTEGIRKKAVNGELLAGTMDSWLLWKLTGGRIHATDYSNACRTMLFNIHTLDWDQDLVSLFGLYRDMLPEVRFSDEIFGYATVEGMEEVPVTGLIGDSHAALFGQHCFYRGMGKATYGTGSSIMMNIGHEPLPAPEGLVTSIGYGLQGKIHYVFEGNIHCTGDTINWLKNEIGLIGSAAETESLARSVNGNEGIYLVPAFVGLGAPYWDNRARACLSGMPRNATRAHIVRAALESIAYQVRDLAALMEEEGGIPLQELRVDGGPTRNTFLMQFQADMLNHPVIRADIEEISALGSAYLGGLATGFWKNLEEIGSLRKNDRSFKPEMDKNQRKNLVKGWDKAVQRARL